MNMSRLIVLKVKSFKLNIIQFHVRQSDIVIPAFRHVTTGAQKDKSHEKEDRVAKAPLWLRSTDL
jgi:hypothetical protein